MSDVVKAREEKRGLVPSRSSMIFNTCLGSFMRVHFRRNTAEFDKPEMIAVRRCRLLSCRNDCEIIMSCFIMRARLASDDSWRRHVALHVATLLK